jgi:hypothetical protein
VLNSLLEKRVIDSDSFVMYMKEPKSGGNWRGRIYSDNIIVNLNITCSVYNRTDLTRQICSVRFKIYIEGLN